jgi:hypothetical protein
VMKVIVSHRSPLWRAVGIVPNGKETAMDDALLSKRREEEEEEEEDEEDEEDEDEDLDDEDDDDDEWDVDE